MSKIAVIGTGYVGPHHRRVLRPPRPRRRLRRHRRGEGRRAAAGRDPDPRGRPRPARRARASSRAGCRSCSAPPTPPRDCEFVYLCVPTPQGDDGSADLSYIEAAAREIAPVLPAEAVVVNKSTVPVGSTRVVERALGRDDVLVVSNPEFLREGSAVHDFLNPDRIVIGADDQSAAIKVASLYLGVTAPLIVTDPASAETIKYAANAFLATKISFVNAVAAICEAVGADVNDVVLGMGYDKRIGHEFLRPGPGLGRLVLPQGHPGAGQDRRGRRLRLRPAQGRHRGQRRAVRPRRRRRSSTSPAARSTASRSRRGASRSRPAPTTSASRRRSRSSAGSPPGAPRSGPTTRPSADARSTASRSSPTRTPPATAPRCSLVLTEWDEFKWLDLDKVDGAHGHARGRRRPQPARPLGAAAPRLRLPRHRPQLMARDRRHRRRRVPRLAPLRAAARPRRRGRRHRQPHHRQHRQHRAPLRHAAASRSSSTTCRRTSGCPGAVDAVMHFASAGVADGLPRDADPDPEGRQPRHPQRPRPGQGQGRPVLPGLHQRGLRRPAGAPADRGLLGPRQPGRAPRRLRRGQALRRGDDDGVPPHHGLDVRIVRIFNTYGPRMRPDDGRVVSNFLVQALQGEPITIYGDGTQTRSASATSTTRSRGFLAPARRSDITGPINIGNPNEFTILELAELVLEVTGSLVARSSTSRCRSTTRRSASPTSRARELLGWEPTVAAPRRPRAHRGLLLVA